MILAVAAFFAFDNEYDLTLLERFAKAQLGFTAESLNFQRACKLFKEIPDSARQQFFKGWLSLHSGDQCCFYEVTARSGSGDSLTEAAWSISPEQEDRLQIRLGLFVSAHSGLPLFYCESDGGADDFTSFTSAMSKAQAAGLKWQVTVVSSRILSAPAFAQQLYAQGYGLLAGLPGRRNPKVREQILAWQARHDHYAAILHSTADDIESSSCDFMLSQIPGKLHLYKNDGAAALEAAGIKTEIRKLTKSLNRQEQAPAQFPSEMVSKYFDITEQNNEGKQSAANKITPNNRKIHEALTLCGCFAIFTTDTELSAAAGLVRHRLQSIYEKNFANLRGEVIGERLLVHSTEAWHGKLFILFISLILRISLHHQLQTWIRKNGSSLRAALSELSAIKSLRQNGRWILKGNLTRPQQELDEILELPLDCPVPTSHS